jgi:DNA-binding CsgD family transcriptional regulator
MVSARLVHTLNQTNNQGAALTKTLGLNDRELEFLKLACTELTYKEIAEKMFLSPRTIDGYRDALFEKLEIKTRVGLVLFAIKNGIVKV